MSQRVLVVDDSPFIRRIISDWVNQDPNLVLVGTATNGQQAIDLALELKPDVITLDIEMPGRDGLSALAEILSRTHCAVIMVSSLTTQGAKATLKSLELGAFDFVTKPEGSSSIRVLECRDELLQKIKAARHFRRVPARDSGSFNNVGSHPVSGIKTNKVVLIAASTGGPKALATLWQNLPKGFPAPILLVQHMPVGFTETFARRLDAVGTVPCKEASHGDRILPGMALVAPGGKHMTVSSDGKIALNEDPLVCGTRPAAEPLFTSALAHYGGPRITGAILTGMGKDGAIGASEIIAAGGTIFGQSEETCTVYGMPKAALLAGGVTKELPLEEIAGQLIKSLEGRWANAS